MQSLAFIVTEEAELKRSYSDQPKRLSDNFAPTILADWSDFKTASGRVCEVEVNVVQKHSLSLHPRHSLTTQEQGDVCTFGDEVHLIAVTQQAGQQFQTLELVGLLGFLEDLGFFCGHQIGTTGNLQIDLGLRLFLQELLLEGLGLLCGQLNLDGGIGLFGQLGLMKDRR